MALPGRGFPSRNFRGRVPTAVAAGQSVAVGQAVESDASQTGARLKSRAVGQTASTENAQSAARSKTRVLGQAVESGTPQPEARLKRRGVAQATSADTTQPVGRSKVRGVAPTAETATSQPVVRIKTRILGQAAETCTARGVTQPLGVHQVTEVDTAQSIARLKRRGLRQASTSDVAQALTQGQPPRDISLAAGSPVDAWAAFTPLDGWALGATSGNTTTAATPIGSSASAADPTGSLTAAGALALSPWSASQPYTEASQTVAVTIPAVSKEYLHVPVTADVSLDTQTVELAFLTSGTPSGGTTWVEADWEGSVGTTRNARLLIGPGAQALAAGTYSVWVRVTDVTEIPVRNAGQLFIS